MNFDVPIYSVVDGDDDGVPWSETPPTDDENFIEYVFTRTTEDGPVEDAFSMYVPKNDDDGTTATTTTIERTDKLIEGVISTMGYVPADDETTTTQRRKRKSSSLRDGAGGKRVVYRRVVVV